MQNESVDHVIFMCSRASQIWRLTHFTLGITNIIFVMTATKARGKAFSTRTDSAKFSKERILAAQGWKMKLLVQPVSRAASSYQNVNVMISSGQMSKNKQEIWNGPYSNDSFPVYAEDIEAGGDAAPSFSMLSEVARSLQITIVGGSIPERSGDRLYNTCCVFGADGKLKGKHRKIGPCQVLEKFGDNAYRVESPDDVFISDVFNIRHLTPYAGENSSLRSSFSEEGESDEDIKSNVPVPATQSQPATSGKATPGSLRRSKRLQNKQA